MLHSKPSCPIDELDRKWIHDALSWFENKLGRDFIKSRENLQLQNYKFKYQDFKSDEAIQYFIEFICAYIDFDPALTEFRILVNDDFEFDSGLKTETDKEQHERKAWPNEDGRYEIGIKSRDLEDPPVVFLSIAYQLVYLKLLRDNVFTFSNGHMIDFAMVLFGFGIRQANAAIRSMQWRDLSWQGWQVQRLGYLNQRILGYLFALLTVYKKDRDQSREANLVPDVKRYYKSSIAYLEYFEPTFETADRIINDEDVFIRKFFYANGKVRQFSHLSAAGMEGLTIFYHENGKVWSERLYKNNIPYTVISNYDTDGDPVEKGTLQNGNGTLYIYGFDGRLDIIEKYENGEKLGFIKQFKP